MDTNVVQPVISIILPTRDGAARISAAIRSVVAQTYPSWELIIIDDGSVDETEAVVQNFCRLHPEIIFHKNAVNLGIQKTLNKGIAFARGAYIARIDDDDTWTDQDKLAQQLEYMAQHPTCALVGTYAIVVDEEQHEVMRYTLPQSDESIRKAILRKNCFVHSSVLARKSFVQKVGGYSELPEARHIEDYDLWLRLGAVGSLANIARYSVTLTMRKGSISGKNKLQQFKKIIKLIARYQHTYPGYTAAYVRSIVRLVIYGFLIAMPIKVISGNMIKWYKRLW
ncbi:glycosyltransferase [Candidatus Woesebacteria bacterium]|nr:glycosyltransferase [Candidatus Woesebacteria bacterium]